MSPAPGKADGRRDEKQADQRARRQHSCSEAAIVSPPEQFGDESKAPVARAPEGKDAAAEAPCPPPEAESKQQARQRQLKGRLVELHRVQRRVGRAGKEGRFGKAHAKGQIGRSTVAAAHQKAADASQGVSEREAWRDHIGEVERGQADEAQIGDDRGAADDESAVKNEAATLEIGTDALDRDFGE